MSTEAVFKKAPIPDARDLPADSLGRILTIREPGALQESRLTRQIGDAAANIAFMQMYALPACSVVAIDGMEVIFPSSLKELDALIDLVGKPGLNAIMHDRLPKNPDGSVDMEALANGGALAPSGEAKHIKN